jgi:predicted Zn-dependent protease/predicted small secreted protein
MKKWTLLLVVAPVLTAVLVTGCETLQGLGTIAKAAGVNPGVVDGAVKSGESFMKAKEKLTPENEYYIGRAVTAQILGKYKAYGNSKANDYLNTMGQAVAAYSDKPETYKGYHFLILDSEEVNAFAAPGGFILVTRGLIRCCKDEDALAAVLAHEVGHVQLEHGLRSISASRWTSFLKTVAVEAGKSLGSEALKEAVGAFEGSIDDISQEMVNKGYSKKLEYEADTAAVAILAKSGFRPAGLTDMLAELGKRTQPGGGGFGHTHPTPDDRIGRVKSGVTATPDVPAPAARKARFEKMMAGV